MFVSKGIATRTKISSVIGRRKRCHHQQALQRLIGQRRIIHNTIDHPSTNNDNIPTPPIPDYHVDTIVIGAGVIGLAIARAIVLHYNSNNNNNNYKNNSNRQHHELLVIDRANQIGTETSSRNSEVIHAGIYYPTNSYKAKFCVHGKELLYRYAQEKQIPYNQCGKFIIANTLHQLHTLYTLQQQAVANGVHDTKLLLSQQEVNDMMRRSSNDTTNHHDCDLIQARYGALYSPSTGIIDSHRFMEELCNDILNVSSSSSSFVSSTIALRTNVIDGHITMPNQKQNKDDPYHIYVGTTTTDEEKSTTQKDMKSKNTNNTSSSPTETTWIACRQLINCSGLWATNVAKLLHRESDTATDNNSSNYHNTDWIVPQQYFCRGTYYKLQSVSTNQSQKQAPVVPKLQHLIYPVPDSTGSGLGIHATIDISGENIKFGPDVEWLDISITNPDDIHYQPNNNRVQLFYDSICTYYPHLQQQDISVLLPDYVGIRPKLTHPSLYSNSNDSTNTIADNTSGNNSHSIENLKSLPFQDFNIVGPNVHGIPGLIHLFGMESPGLTSSMAIGNHIVEILQQQQQQQQQ